MESTSYTRLFAGCILLSLVGTLMGITRGSSGPEPSPRSHFYAIEYKKPVKGAESVASLNVVFFVPTEGKAAEALLRGQLEFITSSMPPRTDVLATPWYSKKGDPVDEEQIEMPDSSTSLIYAQKYKRIMTWREYQAEESETPAGAKVLDVTLDAAVRTQSNGSTVVEGTTNLPDGTALMVSLLHKPSKYFAQAKVTVVGGRFMSEPFSNKGTVLTKGKYELEVVMPISAVQPEAVQKVAGKKGELLGGPLVKLGDLGKTVEFAKAVEIGQP